VEIERSSIVLPSALRWSFVPWHDWRGRGAVTDVDSELVSTYGGCGQCCGGGTCTCSYMGTDCLEEDDKCLNAGSPCDIVVEETDDDFRCHSGSGECNQTENGACYLIVNIPRCTQAGLDCVCAESEDDVECGKRYACGGDPC